ncbi:hypothetical protein ACGLHT_16430 [Pseudomonas sp. PsB]
MGPGYNGARVFVALGNYQVSAADK